MREKLKQLFFLAEDQLNEGSFSFAIRTYELALTEAKKNSEEEIQALNYLGMVHCDAEDYKEAVKYFKRARTVAKKLFGTVSLSYATVLGNEGMISSHKSEFWTAEPILDEAASIIDQLNPFEMLKQEAFPSSQVVEIYSNAGECKARLGKVDDAIELFQKAYKIARKFLPRTEPRRIQAGMELGMLLFLIGKKKESGQIQNKIIDDIMTAPMHPMEQAGILGIATANAAVFMSDIEKSLGRTGKLATASKPIKKSNGSLTRAKAVSNVVPLRPPSRKTPVEATTAVKGYQLLITLKHVSPPVWRRIVVTADCSLAKLHTLIQKAMGWDNSHLHVFRAGKLRFGDPKVMDDVKNERNFSVENLQLKVGSKFYYDYDFGDYWEHSIEVEKKMNADEVAKSGTFLNAEGACPPEDCGGPPGFMDGLEALKNPHTSEDELPYWVSDFSPESLPPVFAKSSKQKKAKQVEFNTKRSCIATID